MIQQRRLLLVFILILGKAFVLSAQTRGQYEPTISNSVRHLTNENGLEQNSTKGIAFDSRGNLWIGTEAGVACYNGISVKTKFKIPTHQRIFHLDTDYNGNICFIDAADDVFIVDSERQEFAKVNSNNPHHRGAFWDLLIGGLPESDIDRFYGFFPGFGHLITSHKQHYFIKRDDDNMHFTGGYGLFWFDKVMKRIAKQQDYQRAFVVDSLIVLVKDGAFTALLKDSILFQTNKLSGDFTRLRGSNRIEDSFFFFDKGHSYAICGNNLYNLKISPEGLHTILIMEDLPEVNGLRHAIYKPELGTLALGTFSSGVYIIKQSAFKWKSLPPQSTRRAHQSSSGDLNNIGAQVIFNDTSVLSSLGVVYSESSFKMQKFGFFRYFLFKDNSKRFWVTNIAQRTLSALDSNLTLQFNIVMPAAVTSMKELSVDTFFISTQFNVFKLEGKTPGPPLLPNDMPPGSEINQIHIHSDSTLLLLTNKGVFRFNYLSGELTAIKGTENYYARQIVQTTSGNVWLGTYGQGFYLLREDNLLGMPLDRKRFLRNSHSFELDDQGFLWISTNNGLFQVLESDLINYADQKTEHIYYHYYDRSDGLRTNEFNGSGTYSSLRLQNGFFSFISIDGLLWFNPSEIKPILPSSEMWVIGQSGKAGTMYEFQQGGELDASSNRVDFEILSSYFGNTYNLFIQYRLIGHDTIWQELPSDFKLTYNNLNHGEYKLELRKMAGFGPDNFTYFNFEFSKKKQYYQTAWFYLLCLLSATGLVIVIIRQREAVLISRKDKLEEIVQERTIILEKTIDMLEKSNEYSQLLLSIIVHDIKSPIQFMQETFKNLTNFWDQLRDKDKFYYVEEMSQSNFQLTAFVQDFITWMTFRQKIEQDLPLEDFEIKPVLDNVARFIKLPSRKNENIIVVQVESDLKVYSNPGLLEIIIRNLAENSAKYMNHGILNISAFVRDGLSVIQVADNGKGMSPEVLQKIMDQKEAGTPDFQSSFKMGYPIIFEMSALLKINVKIESSQGRGTTVQLILPDPESA